MSTKKIGIIGFGNMGSAIAEQLKADYPVICFDKEGVKTKGLLDLEVEKSLEDLIKSSEVIILAVKPQDFDDVLMQMKGLIQDKLIISIAAGITTKHIEESLGFARVVRTMPNIAAKIGQGVTCLSKGAYATEEDFDFVENLFDYLGETKRIDESMMFAATAVSGSGPGFCFALSRILHIDSVNIERFREFLKSTFIPQLTKAAESVGFNPEDAQFLSVTTGNSCESLLVQTKLSPEELCKQVTSRGGTTEAGLKVLESGGSLKQAVNAAMLRAKELSRS